MPKSIDAGQPKMRAATKAERIGDVARNVYESVAAQPLARITDALGLSNLAGVKKEFTTPDSGMKTAHIPTGPFKIGNMSMEILDDAGPALNASGESMASMEAMNRMKGMANRGEQYVVRRGGTTRNLIGPEAVDYNPRPGEEYGILDAGKNFRLLQRGMK